MTPDRRSVLGLAAGLAVSGTALAALLGGGERRVADGDILPRPLRWHAARRGLSFGLAVMAGQLQPGSRMAATIAAEADMIVPKNELKWGETERERGRPDYAAAGRIAAFATAHGQALRGHTAFWYRNVPLWAQPLLAGPEGPALMLRRVADVVAAFRGRIVEWDVVNEAVEPNDRLPGLMRRAPFGRGMDVGYVAELFAAAHAADPAARLYYNDYFLEGVMPYEDTRRGAVLDLLAALRRRGAPVHGLGIQSHIATHLRFKPSLFRDYLREIAGLGLTIRLTEFDVNDRKGTGTVAARDRRIADLGRDFLDAAFDERAVKGVLCWGVTDRDSYLQTGDYRRDDGLPQRPLPFDDALARKPLWYAIAGALDAAPQR